MNNGNKRGFMSEETMLKTFSEVFGEAPKATPTTMTGEDGKERFKISNWYSKAHHEFTLNHHAKVPPSDVFSCDELADLWIQHWLSTPREVNPFMNPGIMKSSGGQYSSTDASSFVFAGDLNLNANVYFAAATAFQKPDLRRVIMHHLGAVLVPVYIVIASKALYPRLDDHDKLMTELMEDLHGIKKDEFEASFDGEQLYGCTVVREEPLTIHKIPKDNIFELPTERLKEGNSMEIVHAGFWLLFDQKKFSPGDHLLYFRANSKNYEMEAKILITTMA
ncbi:MAG: hypothetical protein ACRD8W_03330 [Nitrososphaeraceae archaeon]